MDPLLAVPFKAVQEVSDRMVLVPFRYDVKGFFDGFQVADPISPLTVEMENVKGHCP